MKTAKRESQRKAFLDKVESRRGKTHEPKAPPPRTPIQPQTGSMDAQLHDMMDQIEEGGGGDY